MKIICVGRNYAKHAKELGNEVPQEPVLFIKPSTAINVTNTFELPQFANEFHYELELVLRIHQTIENVTEKNASKFYDQIGLGIDFTARDLQRQLKAKGLPWEIAKAFDNSAFVSSFVSMENMADKNNIRFQLYKNEALVQDGNSKEMLFNFDKIISIASQYFTLKKGDLIFTGTPAGVGQILKGDVLQGKLENKFLFELSIQ